LRAAGTAPADTVTKRNGYHRTTVTLKNFRQYICYRKIDRACPTIHTTNVYNSKLGVTHFYSCTIVSELESLSDAGGSYFQTRLLVMLHVIFLVFAKWSHSVEHLSVASRNLQYMARRLFTTMGQSTLRTRHNHITPCCRLHTATVYNTLFFSKRLWIF